MPPPVAPHLVARNAGNQRVEAAVFVEQLVTPVVAEAKEAAAGPINEAVHGIVAPVLIECQVTETRRTIWKGLEEFAHAHNVVSESLDQRHRAILFREAELVDRDGVTRHPDADEAAEGNAEREQRFEDIPRLAARTPQRQRTEQERQRKLNEE